MPVCSGVAPCLSGLPKTRAERTGLDRTAARVNVNARDGACQCFASGFALMSKCLYLFFPLPQLPLPPPSPTSATIRVPAHRQSTNNPQTIHRLSTDNPQTVHRQSADSPQTIHRRFTNNIQQSTAIHRQSTEIHRQSTGNRLAINPRTTHSQPTCELQIHTFSSRIHSLQTKPQKPKLETPEKLKTKECRNRRTGNIPPQHGDQGWLPLRRRHHVSFFPHTSSHSHPYSHLVTPCSNSSSG